MADKKIVIGIETTADTAGADQTRQAIDAINAKTGDRVTAEQIVNEELEKQAEASAENFQEIVKFGGQLSVVVGLAVSAHQAIKAWEQAMIAAASAQSKLTNQLVDQAAAYREQISAVKTIQDEEEVRAKITADLTKLQRERSEAVLQDDQKRLELLDAQVAALQVQSETLAIVAERNVAATEAAEAQAKMQEAYVEQAKLLQQIAERDLAGKSVEDQMTAIQGRINAVRLEAAKLLNLDYDASVGDLTKRLSSFDLETQATVRSMIENLLELEGSYARLATAAERDEGKRATSTEAAVDRTIAALDREKQAREAAARSALDEAQAKLAAAEDRFAGARDPGTVGSRFGSQVDERQAARMAALQEIQSARSEVEAASREVSASQSELAAAASELAATAPATTQAAAQVSTAASALTESSGQANAAAASLGAAAEKIKAAETGLAANAAALAGAVDGLVGTVTQQGRQIADLQRRVSGLAVQVAGMG